MALFFSECVFNNPINFGLVTTQGGYFDYPVNSTVGILNTL